jgi:hypothetical protein
MPAKQPALTRSLRRKFFLAAGVLSLAIWLFMAAAELYTPLHAWLHGGTIPDDDDDCAIALIAHGKVDVTPVTVDIPATPVMIVGEVLIPATVFSSIDYSLLPGRGPPALLS